MLGLCETEGLGVLPWSPLARGRLTRSWETQGSTERAQSDVYGQGLYSTTQQADKHVVDRLAEVAKNRGIPPAQIALAWMLQKSVVTAPIVGATKTKHLEDAVAAISVTLSQEEIKSLEEPYIPHPLVGFE